MEKFLKVCWKHDKLAGESNCNIENDFEPGTLFFNPANTNKRQRVLEKIKKERFFSNFSTKPHILYEGAIFLRKFNIKN